MFYKSTEEIEDIFKVYQKPYLSKLDCWLPPFSFLFSQNCKFFNKIKRITFSRTDYWVLFDDVKFSILKTLNDCILLFLLMHEVKSSFYSQHAELLDQGCFPFVVNNWHVHLANSAAVSTHTSFSDFIGRPWILVARNPCSTSNRSLTCSSFLQQQ